MSPEAQSAEAQSSEAQSSEASPEGAEALLSEISEALGDAVVGSHVARDDLWVRVRPDSWRHTAEVMRDRLGFDYFSFLSGIDWMPHTWPNPKVEGEGDEADGGQADSDEADSDGAEADADGGWETGHAGGDTRFQVLARLHSTSRGRGVTLKADLDSDEPRVDTWSTVYAGADWHERETWEMYGIDFAGHPNLAHLYLPSAFEGFPLRKDFPLLSREVKPWPGLVDVEGFPPEPEPESEPAAAGAAEATGDSEAPGDDVTTDTSPPSEPPDAEAPETGEVSG